MTEGIEKIDNSVQLVLHNVPTCVNVTARERVVFTTFQFCMACRIRHTHTHTDACIQSRVYWIQDMIEMAGEPAPHVFFFFFFSFFFFLTYCYTRRDSR